MSIMDVCTKIAAIARRNAGRLQSGFVYTALFIQFWQLCLDIGAAGQVFQHISLLLIIILFTSLFRSLLIEICAHFHHRRNQPKSTGH